MSSLGTVWLAAALQAAAPAARPTPRPVPPAAKPSAPAGKPSITPAGKPSTPPAAGPLPTPAPAPTPERRPAPAGLSWEDADHVQRLVSRVERRLRTGRNAADAPVVVTERQLNSYVNLSLAPVIPAGVSGLQLRLDRGRLGAQAEVDLDRVKGRLPPGSTGGLLALLSGTVPVQLTGRLLAANGTGRVELEQASVGGVSLPPSLVAQMVVVATRNAKRPQGFDILAPFPLPWTARDVRLEPGRAVVSFAAR